MGRIKLVIFDLDGTLADTLPDISCGAGKGCFKIWLFWGFAGAGAQEHRQWCPKVGGKSI